MSHRVTFEFQKHFKVPRDNDISVEMLLKSHKVWNALIRVSDEITKMVSMAELLGRTKANLFLEMPIGIWNLI